MSTESASARKKKRIVEHIIGGFQSAKEAMIFGSTVESIVKESIDTVKFKQEIGSPDTKLAITKDWMGETVLRTSFLEVKDHNSATFISDMIKKTVSAHEKINKNALNIINAVVREKPQPQFLR